MADVDAIGEVSTAGQRLRRAREAAGLSLDDVATRTRVPTRHLQAMEDSAWDRLPGPTYVAGFAKSYADMVGLPRTEIGDQIRTEMGVRAAPVAQAFEPADPTRVPPRTLAISAAVLLAALAGGYFYLREDALDEAQPQFTTPVEQPAAPTAAAQPAQPQRPTGPVVLAAAGQEAVWIQVKERNGPTLVSRTLNPGDRWELPATASDPVIQTGRAELLQITVGGQPAPALGPANTTLKDISLRPDALFPATNGPAPSPTGLPAATARP